MNLYYPDFPWHFIQEIFTSHIFNLQQKAKQLFLKKKYIVSHTSHHSIFVKSTRNHERNHNEYKTIVKRTFKIVNRKLWERRSDLISSQNDLVVKESSMFCCKICYDVVEIKACNWRFVWFVLVRDWNTEKLFH